MCINSLITFFLAVSCQSYSWTGEASFVVPETILTKFQLQTNALKGLRVTFDEMKLAVADNEKQRFSLIPKTAAPSQAQGAETSPAEDVLPEQSELPSNFDQDDPANYLIRANQGHSIKIDDDGLLTPITLEDQSKLPDMVVHGTTFQAWSAILKTGGLKRMSRNHIHFARGLPAGFVMLEDDSGTDGAPAAAEDNEESTAARAKKDPVISGMRSTSTILIYIDLPAALQQGLKFGESENGVILTEGDENGVIPLKFFKRVEDRKHGYGILMKNGEVLKELPRHVNSGGGKGKRR